MLGRVHDPKSLIKYPSYKKVTICDDWYYFENFKKWHDNHYIEGYHMDKDILSIGEGDLIYSPDRCIFIPKELNYLLTDSEAIRGRYPQGVSFCLGKMNFVSSISRYGLVTKKGFGLAEDAYKHYVSSKQEHVYMVANKYHNDGIISIEAMDKLLSYELPPFKVNGVDGDVDYLFTYMLYGREFKSSNLYEIVRETELSNSTLRKLNKVGSMRGIRFISMEKLDR